MPLPQRLIVVLSAMIHFLNGLQAFRSGLQTVGGDALRSCVKGVTANRARSFPIGAAATTVSFRTSLGVLLGGNAGTTATTWSVSFRLSEIDTAFSVPGAMISILPERWCE